MTHRNTDTAATPQNESQYRTMLIKADHLGRQLETMSGYEDDFFALQAQKSAMEKAMCQWSEAARGYYNHRYNPLRK